MLVASIPVCSWILLFLLMLICCLVFQKCEVSNLLLKNVYVSLSWFYFNWLCGIWTFCFWEWPLSLTKIGYSVNWTFSWHTYMIYLSFVLRHISYCFNSYPFSDLMSFRSKKISSSPFSVTGDDFCLHHFVKPNYWKTFPPYTKN